MGDAVNMDEVDALIDGIGTGEDALIPILQALQSKYHYLPEAALRRIPERTQITPASVMGVCTFFNQFRLKPAGQHTVHVCIGTACHVKGAETVYEAFRRHLQLGQGEDTDRDRLFTVEKVACLGCCMLAPAVQIDDITYGFVEPPKVGQVLRDFLAAQSAAAPGVPPGGEHPAPSGEVRVCLCSSCVAGGAAAVFETLRRGVHDLGLPVVVKSVGCVGISYQTPLVEVAMNDGRAFRYGLVKPDHVRAILLRHFRPARVATRAMAAINGLLEKLYTDEAWEPVTRYSVDLHLGPDAHYTAPQVHLATECCGQMDPLDLDEYRRHGGYDALIRSVREMGPDAVLEEVARSGLRGRGGAGFHTGTKWRLVKNRPEPLKYIVCNGDEGDPGAFMDRIILESFPFRTIEGMTIAAFVVGAVEGYLYVRAEYPLAVKRVRAALKICEERGLLGDNILGAGFSLRLRLAVGAGAFVCGEETAMIQAIEGRRGMPRFRPPFPAERGLWGHPTLINNVETFTMVPWIVRHGAGAFAALGTETSKGTKSFALAGKVRRGGLIEVPMGISLRRIVDEIGGGIPNERRLKAVQVGGPSGGCVPERLADTPVDYHALTSVGAMMGSGGMVVLDDADCMVDIARYFLTFTQRESCGKCTFCRIGTKRMLEILERLCAGKGLSDDLERLESLGAFVRDGSLCGLGKTAPNPILSTIAYFREEYEAHLLGRCPAKRCKALIRYVVGEKCIGCTRCAQQCPVDAIPVAPYRRHEIDAQKCTRCDACRQACPVEAITIEDLPRTAAAADRREAG